MKIKKRLKYKSTLPKADYGMDPKALSNMNKQAAEETPAQGGGLSMANAALGGINTGLGALSAFTPKDNNDGIGISHKTSNITSGITGGLDAASGIASSIPGVGQAVGAGLGIVSKFITMIKGAVDHKRENDRSITSRLARKEYDPTNNNTGYSFGVPQAPTSQPLFGGQAKYGMPLYGNGGTPIYVTDQNDPRLKSYQDSLAFYNSGEYLNSKLNTGASGMVTKSQYYDALKGAQSKYLKSNNLSWQGANSSLYLKPIRQNPVDFWENDTQIRKTDYDIYKKPLQPVIYKKPEVSVPKPKFNVTIPQEEKQSMQELLGKVQYASEPTSQHEKPVESGTFNNMFTQEVKTMNGKKIYKRKDTKSPWIEQYKNGGEPNIDSTLNANKNLEWVNRLYDQNPQSIQVQGQKYPSTHLLTQADNFVYPEVVKGPDGKLEHLSGEEAYHFAMKNKTAIPFKSEKDALWFTNHYKEGTGVLKGFALGGFINKNKINNSLSNGMFSPNGKFFSSPEQYQQYQSLYNPQFQLQQPIMNNYGTLKMKSDFKNNSFFELGGDPRSQSNIEAEQGEAMQHSSGKIEAIGGKKHPNGGTPLIVQPSHEYIYSDSLGKDKNGNITLNEKDVVRSFADDAKSIQKKYSSREGDPIVDKTKELELSFLKQDAEQARVAKEEIEMGKQMKKYKAKYGANLKRFDNSGFIFNQKDYIDWIKQTPEYKENTLTDLGGSDAATVYRPRYAENIYDQYGADAYNTVVNTFSNRKYGYTPGSDTSKNTYYKTSVGDWPMTNPYSNSGKGIAGNYGGTYPGPIGNKQFLFPNSGGPKPFQPGYLENVMKNSSVDLNKPLNGGIAPTSRAAASMNQRSTPAEVADKVKNGMFDSLTTGDKMQLASMLPAFGFNMGMGLRKADVEPNRKNLYENDVVNIMQNRKFDIQNYLNQSNLATNTAKEDIGNNSTSVGGKMANLQKLYANQLGTLGDITTKGQEMNNQYRAEEANTKNILGEANRAESIRAAGINDQNKARKQQFLAKAFEQMGQGLATTGQSANQSLTNKLLIKSLSEISPDFDVKNMKDIEVDNEGYIVFKGQKTEFKMSDEGKIVMAGGTPNTANAIKSQYAPKDFIMKTFANFTKAKTK